MNLCCGNDLVLCGNDLLTHGNEIKNYRKNSMSLPRLHKLGFDLFWNMDLRSLNISASEDVLNLHNSSVIFMQIIF